jgi:hypothetical protein
VSGPKCGSVEVQNWDAFEQRAAQREASERQELRALSKERRLAEAEQRRLERLRERELKRQREAEENRQRALKELGAVRHKLDKLAERQRDLAARFPQATFPETPIEPSVDERNTDSILAATASLTDALRRHQHALDVALMTCHRQAAVAESRSQMDAWAASFSARVTVTTRDAIAALEQEAALARRAQGNARLHAHAARAKEMVAGLASDDDAELSEDVLAALGAVVNAASEADAAIAVERLIPEIGREKQRRQAAADRERLRRERQRTRAIAAEIEDVLEDLGYAVSGIEETAFVRDGHLYAMHRDFPNHAVRLELGRVPGEIRAVPVRVSAAESVPREGDETMRREDAEFDAAWCGADGLGEFRKLAATRGLRMSFRAQHRPGSVEIPLVDEKEVGEALRRKRQQAGKATASRARTRERKPGK